MWHISDRHPEVDVKVVGYTFKEVTLYCLIVSKDVWDREGGAGKFFPLIPLIVSLSFGKSDIQRCKQEVIKSKLVPFVKIVGKKMWKCTLPVL